MSADAFEMPVACFAAAFADDFSRRPISIAFDIDAIIVTMSATDALTAADRWLLMPRATARLFAFALRRHHSDLLPSAPHYRQGRAPAISRLSYVASFAAAPLRCPA